MLVRIEASQKSGSLGVALVPHVVWRIDGDGGDAVVPAFGGVSRKTGAEQRVDIVIDAEAAASEAAVLEDLDEGSVEDADGGDLVVESAGQGGPAVAGSHAEVVALEIDVPVEAGSRARLLRVSPLPLALLVTIRILGDGGERRQAEQQKDDDAGQAVAHGGPLSTG
jgi:hypothetical protein